MNQAGFLKGEELVAGSEEKGIGRRMRAWSLVP